MKSRSGSFNQVSVSKFMISTTSLVAVFTNLFSGVSHMFGMVQCVCLNLEP